MSLLRAILLVTVLATGLAQAEDTSKIHFASGVKIGEVDQTSAILWVRLSEEPEPRFGQMPVMTEGATQGSKGTIMPTDTVPGAEGDVRVRYGLAPDKLTEETKWMSVGAKGDFIHQFA